MPRNENRMPGPRGRAHGFEKPKDFSSAIKNLVHELKNYQKLIVISCVLAMLSSVLSIVAPNRLSDLTDNISKGLRVDDKSISILTKQTTKNLNEDNLRNVVLSILGIDDFESVYGNVMSSNISSDDKAKFDEIMSSGQIMTSLGSIPDSVLDVMLTDSEYKGVTITKDEKKNFIKSINSKNIDLSDSMVEVIFSDLTVNGIKIKKKDQYEFLKVMGSVGKKTSAESLYKKLDSLPKSIQKVIRPKMDLDSIKFIGIVLIIIYVLSSLFNYIQSVIMSSISNNFACDLRKRISFKINKLPLKYFDKHLSGDILSRVTNDVDTIAQTMNQSLASLVSSLTLFLGSLIMMFVTNYVMAFTAIISSFIGFFGMSFILKKSQGYFKERQRELGNLNGHIEEVYSGLIIVKAYNGNEEADRKFNEYNDKVCESNKKSQFISGMMQPLMGFIGNFGYVMVCIVGALLAANGSITFGVIVAFMIYIRLFTQPLSQLAQALTSMQSAAAASERVFEFISEEEMNDESKIKTRLDGDKVKGNILFENVSFKYDGNDKPTINNFTASAKAGQKIAIVGPTGAGKTTMVNLLMKFYDIDGGDIKIDGVSTKDLSRENIHNLFTMVLQDTWLFNGTIRENIVFNQENVSLERIDEVCKEVGVDHFIKTLPKGYDTVLSDNDSVSAGQRQLLTIARGMIQNTPFLILDEATSNVDTRTEELVQKAMDKLARGKTSFIIAHRLSTIKNADLILVMRDGNIVEQGNHDELIDKGGFYKELYNSQFENN